MYTSVPDLVKKTTASFGLLPAFSVKSGFRTKTYSYSQIAQFAEKFHTLLRNEHLKPGDTVVVLSLNRPEYAVTILGAMLSGVTIVPIDYRTNQETIRKFVTRTRPKLIFTSRLFTELFAGIHGKQVLFDTLFTTLQSLEPTSGIHPNPNELAAILFTSGTTGEPKGTMITYENVIASINNIRGIFSLRRGLRILSILPLSHALEMFGGLLTSYSYGCHIHYLERINSITIIQALRRYHIQAMAVVPQMLRLLLQNIERHVQMEKKQAQWQRAHQLAQFLPFFLRAELFHEVHLSLGNSFEFFVSGSAPLETKVAQEWRHMGIDIIEGYGASETTGFVSTNTISHNKIGTVGRFIPGIAYQTTESGELLVKGKNVVSGYFNNPEKTADSFTDDWFHTGDIVQIDKAGYVRIVGRDKFKIVLPDGKKVYPEDIEKKLNNHPMVIDSTVFGINQGEGEIVHAEIITKHPRELAQIIETVNQTLNPHEQIMDFGLWHDQDFPRTKTLKVDREAVRDAVQKRTTGNHHAPQPAAEPKDTLLHILSTVSGKKPVAMQGHTTLATDLKLDSLKRVELLALIEEEMGVTVDEVKITPQTTVAELRKLIEHGKPTVVDDGITIPEWQLSRTTERLRLAAQDFLAFPLLSYYVNLTIVHPENLKKIKTPQLFIFNHVGCYDVVNSILRTVPRDVRRKTTIAATHVLWQESKFNGFMSSFVGNCIPFVKAESNGAVRGNFERVGQLLDMGYNIAISPEANITHTGELLPFHTGVGYMAIEMGVPVTPFKLNGYLDIWPEENKRKGYLYWPKHRGTAEVIIGEPITFTPGTSYEEATKILRQTMLDLH